MHRKMIAVILASVSIVLRNTKITGCLMCIRVFVYSCMRLCIRVAYLCVLELCMSCVVNTNPFT